MNFILPARQLAWAALALCVLPLAAIHAALVISIIYETVPAQLPHLEARFSVSRAGRYPPASYLFKSVIIPCGVLGAVYWLSATQGLAKAAGRAPRPAERVMGWIGAFGALLIILYAIALGQQTDFYRFMRRIGIYAYFFGVSGAQILWVVNLQALNRARQLGLSAHLRWLWGLLALMAILVFIGIPGLYWLTGARSIAERTVEWNYLLPMHGYFLVAFFVWRRLAAGVAASPPNE